MSGKIIKFYPRGYIKPEERQAVIESVQEDISDALHRSSLSFADILRRMQEDVIAHKRMLDAAAYRATLPQPFDPGM